MILQRLILGAWLGALGFIPARADTLRESAPLATRIGRTTVVSAEVTSHGMFVRVMISGQGPYRMLIDTGCSFSVISPEVAAAINASGREVDDEDADVAARNGLGETLAVPQVLLDSVEIGGVTFEGVLAGVVPLGVQSEIEDRPLDGLLGYSLFADLFFALDYPGHRLVLSPDWPKGLPPVRAQLALTQESGVPFVTATAQGRKFQVMVDLGANDSFHLPSDLVTGLRWKVGPRPGFLLAVAGGGGREQIGRLAGTLELGRLRQSNPVVGLSEGPATIGVGLLRSYCLVFHEAENKLWLCSPSRGSVPSPPVRTLGLSLMADPGGWRVAGIIPGSPAEKAGINAGDLVTQMEGLPASDWRPDQIQGWIDTHATMALHLAAAAAGRQLRLPVWTLVP